MYVEKLYGKIAYREKNILLTVSFEIKFSYLKCVAYLSIEPILKSSRRRLVKLFETGVTLQVAVSNNFTKRRVVLFDHQGH